MKATLFALLVLLVAPPAMAHSWSTLKAAALDAAKAGHTSDAVKFWSQARSEMTQFGAGDERFCEASFELAELERNHAVDDAMARLSPVYKFVCIEHGALNPASEKCLALYKSLAAQKNDAPLLAEISKCSACLGTSSPVSVAHSSSSDLVVAPPLSWSDLIKSVHADLKNHHLAEANSKLVQATKIAQTREQLIQTLWLHSCVAAELDNLQLAESTARRALALAMSDDQGSTPRCVNLLRNHAHILRSMRNDALAQQQEQRANQIAALIAGRQASASAPAPVLGSFNWSSMRSAAGRGSFSSGGGGFTTSGSGAGSSVGRSGYSGISGSGGANNAASGGFGSAYSTTGDSRGYSSGGGGTASSADETGSSISSAGYADSAGSYSGSRASSSSYGRAAAATPNSDTVNVSGYTRADGTVIKPHIRTAADDRLENNFSYPGNSSPSVQDNERAYAASGSTSSKSATNFSSGTPSAHQVMHSYPSINATKSAFH